MKARICFVLMVFILAFVVFFAACGGGGGGGDDDGTDNDTDDDSSIEGFDEYCGDRKPEDTFEDVVYAYDNGKLTPHTEEIPPYLTFMKKGDIEANKFYPEHPFMLEAISAYFLGKGGKVRIAVFDDVGNSWPHAFIHRTWPTEDKVFADFELEVPDDAGWVKIELDEPILFYPRDQFWIGYVHKQDQTPYLGLGMPNELFDLNRLQSMYYSVLKHDKTFIWNYSAEPFMLRAEGKHFCKVEETWFTNITESAGLAHLNLSQVAFGDVNNDGYDDVIFHTPTTLFINNGDGTFTDMTENIHDDSGLLNYASFASISDLDNDGDQDVYLGVYVRQEEDYEDPGFRSSILENDGTGEFTVVENSGVGLEATTSTAAIADFDGDTYLDIFVGNWLKIYPYPESFCDFLFKNNGDLTFTDVSNLLTDQVCVSCYGAEWADFDNDGQLELFVANYGRSDNYLWDYDGEKFINVAYEKGVAYHEPGTGGNTFSADFGDIDSDGDLDLYLAEIAHPRYQPSSDPSSLNINSGASEFKFTDKSEELGLHWDEGEVEVNLIDFDNDGDLDIMISSVYPFHFSRLFRQNADGKFEEVTYLAGLVLETVGRNAWSDIDRDGDLDVILIQHTGEERIYLYRNEIGNKNHWFGVKLVGVNCNRDAIGARVYLTACGKTQMREIKSARGHFSTQSTRVAHFGLGDCTDIDKLEVKWPTGKKRSFTDVEPDKYYILEEGSGLEVWD